MTIKELYAIKDVKIGFYAPYEQANEAVAKRTIKVCVNDTAKNLVNEAPEDKELWKIGDFNADTGEFISDVRFICKAIDFKEN